MNWKEYCESGQIKEEGIYEDGEKVDAEDDGSEIFDMDLEWPRTLKEAVKNIILDMSEEDKQKIKSTSKDDLIMFHHGWGAGIRNAFGLWAGNQELLDSCGADEPDDASMAIIKAVWKELRADEL